VKVKVVVISYLCRCDVWTSYTRVILRWTTSLTTVNDTGRCLHTAVWLTRGLQQLHQRSRRLSQEHSIKCSVSWPDSANMSSTTEITNNAERGYHSLSLWHCLTERSASGICSNHNNRENGSNYFQKPLQSMPQYSRYTLCDSKLTANKWITHTEVSTGHIVISQNMLTKTLGAFYRTAVWLDSKITLSHLQLTVDLWSPRIDNRTLTMSTSYLSVCLCKMLYIVITVIITLITPDWAVWPVHVHCRY